MPRRGGGFEFRPDPDGQRMGTVREALGGTGGGSMEAEATKDVCITHFRFCVACG